MRDKDLWEEFDDCIETKEEKEYYEFLQQMRYFEAVEDGNNTIDYDGR